MAGEEENTTANPVGGVTWGEVEVRTSNSTTSEEPTKTLISSRERTLRTMCVYGSFMAMGWINSLIGASLVDIEFTYGIETKTASFVFMSYNLGYVIGCIILGFLYERLHADVQIAMGVLVFSLAAGSGLFCSEFIWFAVVMGVKGIGMGYVDSAAQPYTLALWMGLRLQNPVLHLSHCLYSLGSFTAPLILQPFLLPERPSDGRSAMTSNNSFPEQNASDFQSKTFDLLNCTNVCTLSNGSIVHPNLTVMDNTSDVFDFQYSEDQLIKVKYGYITIASFCMPVVLAHVIVFVQGNLNMSSKEEKDSLHKDSDEARKTRDTRILLVFLFFLLFFYEITEDVSGSLVATYVIKGLKWNKSKGPLVTSVLWGAGFGGHLVSIPVSYFLNPTQMVVIGNGLVTSSFTLLLVNSFILLPETAIWAAVATSGIGFSSYLGCVFLWAATYIDVDGIASSVCLMATACGAITGSWGTGILFDLYTPHVFVYVVFSCCISVMFIFFCANFFAKHSSLRTSDITSEKSNRRDSSSSHTVPYMGRRNSLALHLNDNV